MCENYRMTPPLSASVLPDKSLVLVVDDVSKNLQVVGTMLRKENYRVVPATSGTQALERVRAEAPDLVLLDLMMPEMDGLEVCRRLKADPLTQRIPVIFLTASNEMEHLVQGFEMGAVDYITKPFNPPELLARVRTHLELKHARERLREMNDEKNEFMGIAAHDLRNPLGSITGFSEIILEELRALQPSNGPDFTKSVCEATQCTERIRDASRRMAEMVQNLLDANRIERGEMKLDLASTELVALVSSVVETQRPRAAAKQQKIALETDAAPVPALVDSDVMVQVLENLVSNAIKYSPPGRSIFMRLKRDTGTVRIEVQDEGPGLSAEDQKKLFGKFARLSAKPTGGEHATGLGLSIVKRMVEAMNGKVWCESEPGRGATFIVTVPEAAMTGTGRATA
jgi:two-component system, sensor histidine kinase and response regulator